MPFDYSLDYKNLDLRAHPELYRVGVGEQGVLLVEPYKSEILPHWRFATPEVARESSEAIFAMFRRYGEVEDFVGMDMARKFLQMGMTRARRYANHKGGKKYDGPVPDGPEGAERGGTGGPFCRTRWTPSRPRRRRSSGRSGKRPRPIRRTCG